MAVTITYVSDAITSYLDHRFLSGLILSVQPLLNSVFRATFSLPKSDDVTLLKNLFRVFYHLPLCHLYELSPWLSLWPLSFLPCSLFSSSTGLVSWHSPLSSWGLTPPHPYNLIWNITAPERTMFFCCYLQSSLSFFFKAHVTTAIH